MTTMSRVYHEGHRTLQERFDTRKLADRIEERLVQDAIDESDKAFIERMSMFFLATSDEHGSPQCSYKAGAPGFVRVLDERTIAFPSYDGNAGRRMRNAGARLEASRVGARCARRE